jgi:alpha-1,3-glucosyltransferase
MASASASAIASPHKPRRKAKKTAHFDANVKPEALVRSPTFPLEALLWPARTSHSQWEILPLILMAAGLFRWAAGLWGYSGVYTSTVMVLSLWY